MNFIKKLKNGFRVSITGEEAERIIRKIFTAFVNNKSDLYIDDCNMEGWTIDSTMEEINE